MAIRFPIAVFFGIVAYMVAMVMTVYDGLPSLIFQPIMGLILTGIACIVLLALGSPLLITKIWNFWRRVWWLPVLLKLAGIVSMFLSWHPALRIQVWDPDRGMMVDTFNEILAPVGYAAMLFGILWCPKLSFSKDGRWY